MKAAPRFNFWWYWLALVAIALVGLCGFITIAAAFSGDRPCGTTTTDDCGGFVDFLHWWASALPQSMLGVAFHGTLISFLMFLVWAIVLVTHHASWRRRTARLQ